MRPFALRGQARYHLVDRERERLEVEAVFPVGHMVDADGDSPAVVVAGRTACQNGAREAVRRSGCRLRRAGHTALTSKPPTK
jgi:hypothetical protein